MLTFSEEIPGAGGVSVPSSGGTTVAGPSWHVYKAEATTIADDRDSKFQAEREREWERRNPNRQETLQELKRRLAELEKCNTF